jgi:hypothetical protein
MNESSLKSLSALQKMAFKVLPRGRNALLQIFIERAPTDMLSFCVDRYMNGTDNEREIINYLLNNRQFGFTDKDLRDRPHWIERDNDICEAFISCLDLMAIAYPTEPLRAESLVMLISMMPDGLRRRGVPVTRESLRSRFLLNTITRKLLSRTVILDGYVTFIENNREAIERNLETILEKNLVQAKDIRIVIDAHPALVTGAL